MLVITDKPLGSYFDSGYHIPSVCSNIVSSVNSSDDYKAPLRFGAMELFPCLDISDDLLSLLPSGKPWYRYRSSSYPDYDYVEALTFPYNDRKFLFDTADLFFVYWYLANIGDTIA